MEKAKITYYGGSTPPPETKAAIPEKVEVTEWDGSSSSASEKKPSKSQKRNPSQTPSRARQTARPSRQDQKDNSSADSVDGDTEVNFDFN